MSKRSTLIVFFTILGLGLYSQRPTIELTFTAASNAAYVQLDSIKIMNRTLGGDTVLYWPDTVLSINYVGIREKSKAENMFQVFQNYPNPAAVQTIVSLYIPEKDKVSIIVADVLGRTIILTERVLDRGKHSFRFTIGNGSLYFFTASWQGRSSSIKILHTEHFSDEATALEYTGSEDYFPQLKAMNDILDFSFTPGDELLLIGYSNGLESGMLDSPEESTTYTFQFATNIPCPGTSTVEYEGQVYNTIQIFSQCWLKENLNVGEMIPGTMEQWNNRTIEKYCYNNEPDSCAKYGGLYQWWEMMQYTTQQGAQGICPPGWHLPTDEEWKVLEGAVDSQYGIGNPEWENSWDYRGFDVGLNLKTSGGWYESINGVDLYGFSGHPGGFFDDFDWTFYYIGNRGYWWSSTPSSGGGSWHRTIDGNPEIYRVTYINGAGMSVRCLKNIVYMPTIE